MKATDKITNYLDILICFKALQCIKIKQWNKIMSFLYTL